MRSVPRARPPRDPDLSRHILPNAATMVGTPLTKRGTATISESSPVPLPPQAGNILEATRFGSLFFCPPPTSADPWPRESLCGSRLFLSGSGLLRSFSPEMVQSPVAQGFEVLVTAEGVRDDVPGQQVTARVGVHLARPLVQPLQGCRKRISRSVQIIRREDVPLHAEIGLQTVHCPPMILSLPGVFVHGATGGVPQLQSGPSTPSRRGRSRSAASSQSHEAPPD